MAQLERFLTPLPSFSISPLQRESYIVIRGLRYSNWRQHIYIVLKLDKTVTQACYLLSTLFCTAALISEACTLPEAVLQCTVAGH